MEASRQARGHRGDNYGRDAVLAQILGETRGSTRKSSLRLPARTPRPPVIKEVRDDTRGGWESGPARSTLERANRLYQERLNAGYRDVDFLFAVLL